MNMCLLFRIGYIAVKIEYITYYMDIKTPGPEVLRDFFVIQIRRPLQGWCFQKIMNPLNFLFVW